ncbi:MAG: hypothetical protein HC911_15515 [Chloroflexaceae bacterium]|nr:hypothetical protein [Chloroflexaceae bacterium]
MNPPQTPFVLCVPCTMLTALLAMIIVVLADLQIVGDTTHYTRTYTLPYGQQSMQITLVLDQQVRCELLLAPLTAPVPPVSSDERVV